MVSLLVWLLVFALICWAVYYIISLIPLPGPGKQIALVVLGILALIVLIEHVAPLLGAGSTGTAL